MRILVTLAVALAIMAGLVVAIVAAGRMLTEGAKALTEKGPMTGSTLSKIAYGVLWLLVAGVSAGLIGAA
jgi:hypothetical protein